MKHIGIIVTPSYFESEKYGIVLTDEFSIRAFELSEYNFKPLDIVVFDDTESKITNLHNIVFEFGSKEWMYYNYFRVKRQMNSYIQGDLSLFDVILNFRLDYSSNDSEWVSAYKNGRLDCKYIALNETLARQNNYNGASELIGKPHVIELLKNFVLNPLWSEWKYGYRGIEKIYEIYNFIKGFNEIEVFESYRIEILSHTISKVGGDDRYYEDKVYSIKYIDEYLEKWFKNESINLHKDSGYTSHFDTVNEYKRFYEEENTAKQQAYSEYDREEHLQYLIKHYLVGVAKLKGTKTGTIGFDKNLINFLDVNWSIKKVFEYIYSSYKKAFNYRIYGLSYNQRLEFFFDELQKYTIK